MRDKAHELPPLNMRPLTLGTYAVLQAVCSRYLIDDAQPSAVDAVVWWYIHTAPIHDACALSQVAPAAAEVIALAAAETMSAADVDAIDAWARQSVAVLAASRAESREISDPPKN